MPSTRTLIPSRSACLAVAVATVLAGALVAGCGSSAPSLPHRAKSNLVSIFESEGLLDSNPPLAIRTFKALGADVIRFYIPWSTIAPDSTSPHRPVFQEGSPAGYAAGAWTVYDEIVRDAAAAGIGLDLTLGPPAPLWAGGPGAPAHSIYKAEWEPSSSDFGAFVRAVGERYSGHYRPPGAATALPRVSFWSIWNEPNYGPYLAPQAIDHSQVEVAPRLYRGIVDAAWDGLAASGHTPRTDTILIGETAPRGLSGPNLPGNFSGMVPLRFIRALYCVGADLKPLRGTAAGLRGCPVTLAGSRRFAADNPALFQASGFADHPYPDSLAPNVRTPPPVGTDYADFAALGSLEQTLDGATAAYGRHVQLPIYSTEFGYRTNPPASLGLSPLTAASYLNEAEYLSWRSPRIRSYDQYLLSDPPGSSPGLFATGLEFANGRPKPGVYDAYRMPLYLPVTHGQKGHALQVWGCVRPAPETRRRTGRAQTVAIQFAPTGSTTFRTVKTVTVTDPHGYFDVNVSFPAGGSVRLTWNGSGPALHSRTQAISLG